jgi:hypothetical protein
MGSKLDHIVDRLEAVLATHKSNAILVKKTMYPGYVKAVFNEDVTRYNEEFSLCTGREVVVNGKKVRVKL